MTGWNIETGPSVSATNSRCRQEARRVIGASARVASPHKNRGGLTSDACTESVDGRSVAVSGPCRDLPGNEGHLAPGLEDPHLLRPQDRQVSRGQAGRSVAPREPDVLAVPAARRHAAILARLRLPRALGAVAAAPAVVAAVSARQGWHRLLARDLLPRRADRVDLHRHAGHRLG